jgi:hypothetical protein
LLQSRPLTPEEARQYERRISDRLDAQDRQRRKGERPADEGTFAKIGSRVYRDRRLKAAQPFISLLVQYSRAGERPQLEEYQQHIASKLGVTVKTVYRWQIIAAEGEMVLTETRKGRGRRNRYTVLPAALAPARDPGAPTRPRRPRVKSDRNVRLSPTDLKPTVSDRTSPPDPLPASGKGDADGASRAAVGSPGEPGRPAARVVEGQRPTATPPCAPLAAPSEPAIDTRAVRAARQGASAISPRAPP